MDGEDDQILPFVLEVLSQKPKFCDTFDNLCRDLQDNCTVREKYQKTAIPNLVENAVKIGQGLGIVTLNQDKIRMPFTFYSKSSHVLAPNLRNEEIKDETATDKSNVSIEDDNIVVNDLEKCRPRRSKMPKIFRPFRTRVKPRMPQIRKVCSKHRSRTRNRSIIKKRLRRPPSRGARRPKPRSGSRKCRR